MELEKDTYYKDKKEYSNAYSKQYYQKNKAKYRLYQKQYYIYNKSKISEQNKNKLRRGLSWKRQKIEDDLKQVERKKEEFIKFLNLKDESTKAF